MTMNHYRQPILLFGLALPVLGIAVMIGGGIYLKNQVVGSCDTKQKLYNAVEGKRRSVSKIENAVVKQRDHLERWNKLLDEDSLSTVNANLREIIAKLPQKEIQKGGFERSPTTASNISAQKSSEIRVSFRATFRTMQRALLELETRMPNLQLLELRISPNIAGAGGQGVTSTLLNFQVSFLAWEN